jgi:hypothetical protein
MEDNWKHRSARMTCQTCMYFIRKEQKPINHEGSGDREMTQEEADDMRRGPIGRCRRNAPTMKGWPVLFGSDWCGEHKLDENAI